MLFYPADKLKSGIYSYGAIRYKFNKNKKLLKVKVYYQKQENSYLLFDTDKSGKFDIFLFGKIYRKNIPYYFPIDSLKYLSLNKILSLLKYDEIYKDIIIKKDDSSLKIKFIQKIIMPSLGLKFVDDGAKDEFGKYVYILSEKMQQKHEQGVNCSGFVKEIAENYIRLYNPLFKGLKISDIKHRRAGQRKNISYQYYDLEYDPFFGLDWAKNIADKINLICEYKIIKAEVGYSGKFIFDDGILVLKKMANFSQAEIEKKGQDDC